jgi:hypothetical protein
MMEMKQQHDDHCWLTVGGEGWAIHSMYWPTVFLWRGYSPNIELCAIDLNKVDWESYYRKWAEMNELSQETTKGLVEESSSTSRGGKT